MITGAAESSLNCLSWALDASQSAREFVADRFPQIFNRVVGGEDCELRIDSGDVLFTFGGHFPAGRAGELTILLKPSELYLELMAAVASHVQADVITVHGWPFLSVDGLTASTVSEAAGESIPGGGAAPPSRSAK